MKPAATWMLRLDAALHRACLGLGVVALALIVVLAFAQVLARYVWRQPLVWSEELATYLFIWLSMLGAAAAVHTRGHYGLDLVLKGLPGPARSVAEGFALIVCMAFAALVAWLGGDMALAAGNRSASLGVGMLWFYLALPFGAWVMVFHFLVRLLALVGLLAPRLAGPSPATT